MTAAPRRFVNVVAEKYDEIEVFARHVTVGGVIALFVLLARGESKTQAIGGCARGRGRASAPRRADRIAGHEPVPIPARGIEAARFDARAMCERRPCRDAAPACDVVEMFILR